MNRATEEKRPTIVFDLGGVLIDWNPRYLYRQLFDGDDERMEYFLAHICSPEWNAQQDAGRPFAEAVEERIRAFPRYDNLISAYFARWPEMIAGSIVGTVAVMSELREHGYPLVALSNWSAETFPFVKYRFEFFNWFDQIVLSGEEGCIKPDPQIYRILLDRIQSDAGQCLLIDDSEENIITARSLGFNTILFTSPDHLRAELIAISIMQRPS